VNDRHEITGMTRNAFTRPGAFERIVIPTVFCALILTGFASLAPAQQSVENVINYRELLTMEDSSNDEWPTDQVADVDRMTTLRGRLNHIQQQLDQDQIDSAIDDLEKLIEDEPSLLKAWEMLGWAYWRAERRDETIALWESLHKLDPQLPLACNLLGMAYAGKNDLAQSAYYYQKSLELDPDQYGIQFNMARIHRWIGMMDESVARLRRLAIQDPERLDVRIELARSLTDNREFEEAVPLWTEALESNPTDLEYLVRTAYVLFHTGNTNESRELVDRILEVEPDNLVVQLMLADDAEYGDRPEDAIPALQKIVRLTEDANQKRLIRNRLLRLLVRLNKAQPSKFGLVDPISLTREVINDEPYNVDARLLLGELLMMDRQFDAAEKQFLAVLSDFNRDNLRARRDLFELYLAGNRYQDALRQYKILESFNPRDPYLFYRQARLEESRGNYRGALKALEKLEQAGQKGAVAVLLYHGLTTSEKLEITSVSRFKEQLTALKNAGFKFITPEDLPRYLSEMEKKPAELRGAVPERIVSITFDDARRDSMRLGTEVAKELGLTFAMHVPVGNVERGDPFITTWDQLEDYDSSGAWVFGSHLRYASDNARITKENQTAYSLPNRVWLDELNRMESEKEYLARVRDEYSSSRRILQEKLGHPVTFVAYPMGDIGQETVGNMPGAIELNLAESATNYQVGFIQSAFGYAVNGDNPLLYQRHEMGSKASGEDVVHYILANHPEFLARRMRAEIAAFRGNSHTAMKMVEELKRDGYPDSLASNLNQRIHTSLAGQFAAPVKTEKASEAPSRLDIDNPYAGVRFEYFEDNLDSENYRFVGLGGLNVSKNVIMEGRVGAGQLKQSATNLSGGNIPTITLDEQMIGLVSSYASPHGWIMLGEVSERSFSGTIPDDPGVGSTKVDESFVHYAVEGQARPLLTLDLAARYEHNIVPAARAVAKDTTYDLASINGLWSMTDWWKFQFSGLLYDFSDDNSRDHFGLGSRWLVWDAIGLYLGVRYDYADAEMDNPDYWTPYKLNRYYLEAELRGQKRNTYYMLRLRYGIGQQRVRPEARAAHDELVARSIRENFPLDEQQAILNARPEEDWEAVLGLAASIDAKLTANWRVNGEISYNKVPGYDEINLTTGLKYSF